MSKIFHFLILLFLLAGCSSGAESVAPPPSNEQRPSETTATVAVTPVASMTPGATNTLMPPGTLDVPSATASPEVSQPDNTPVLEQSSGSLTVQLFSDSDVEVSVPKYLVSGRAPAETVLSINDEIAVVDQNQSFAIWIPLEDGPNVVEIVASNDAGDEVSFVITVTYTAQP